VPSPGCEKLRQYRALEVCHFPLKSSIRSIHRPAGIEGLKIKQFLAPSASQAFFPSAAGEPVLRLAFRANGYDQVIGHGPLHCMIMFNTPNSIFQSYREKRRNKVLSGHWYVDAVGKTMAFGKSLTVRAFLLYVISSGRT